MSRDAWDQIEDGSLVKILDVVEDFSFKGLFRVIRARLRYRQFDGHMSEEITRINFERGDSVGVLLYDPDEDVVLLIRQFRYPVYASINPEIVKAEGAKQAWLLEIVAGIIDPGHSAVEITSKELLEESGYVVQGDLRPIATIYPSPGGDFRADSPFPRPGRSRGSTKGGGRDSCSWRRYSGGEPGFSGSAGDD